MVVSVLEQRIKQNTLLGEVICAAMEAELRKLGFEHPERLSKSFGEVEFELSRDPFDGQYGLKGMWRNAQGRAVGQLIFHADGTFYVEYDVVRPHPTNRRWFVDAVTAWGRGDQVKTEVRLLPTLM